MLRDRITPSVGVVSCTWVLCLVGVRDWRLVFTTIATRKTSRLHVILWSTGPLLCLLRHATAHTWYTVALRSMGMLKVLRLVRHGDPDATAIGQLVAKQKPGTSRTK